MQTSTSSRVNALLTAVIDGDMSYLITHVTARNVNYADPRYRLTLLQWAVSLGRLPTTELLLARGASLMLLDGNGFTPLHRAVWCADVAVARALLFLSPASAATHGAAATARTTSSFQAQAVQRQEPRALGHEGSSDAADGFSFTCWLADQTRLQETLRNKATAASSWRPGAQQLVNMPHGVTGRTPLMLAAVRGAVPLVAFLLDECEADLNVADADGYTAAELAALCGHLEILNLFLARAPGDGTGRAFARIQQRAEDYTRTAKTVKQLERLRAVNRRVCEDLAPQSVILPG